MDNTGTKRLGGSYLIKESKRVKTDLPENEPFVNQFSIPPSLQSIALVSAAVQLWTENDPVQELLSPDPKLSFIPRGRNYRTLKDKVLKKIASLFLPNSIKEKLTNVIEPIGSQIFTWISAQIDQYLSLHELFKRGCSLSWTMEGTIDKISSLENLIKDKLINEKQENSYVDLYSLACKYCLEEYIPILWSNIPLDLKSAFDFVPNNYRDHIVNYWTADLKNELPSLSMELKQQISNASNFWGDMYYSGKVYDANHNIFQNMISLSLCVGNVAALKYFWSKLSQEEKDSNVEKWLLKVLGSDYDYFHGHKELYRVRTEIFCFLLSQVRDQSLLNEIFKSFSGKILKYLFLNWPFQRFFLPTITMMLPYLSNNTYLQIMLDVAKKMEEENTAHSIFKNIWYLSPLQVKRLFVQEMKHSKLSVRAIIQFLNVNDIEMAYAILKDAASSQNLQDAVAAHGQEIMWTMARNLLYSDNLDLVDTFVSNALADEDLHSFRKQVVGYSTEKVCFEWMRYEIEDNFETAEKFLDWSLQSLYEIGDCYRSFETFLQDFCLGFDPWSIYIRLAFLGNYDRANQFLTWHFPKSEAIKEVKVFVYKNYSNEIGNILENVAKCEKDRWDHLERFLNYILSDCSSEEKTQFKNLYLEDVQSLVFKEHLSFVSFFLSWCFDSDEEIKNFKHELFQSEKHINYIFRTLVHHGSGYISWFSLKYLMKWYSPVSSELISNFKSKLSPLLSYKDDCGRCEEGKICQRENKRRAFFHILDSLDYEDSDSDSESASTGEDLSSMFDELILLDSQENISDGDDICSVNTDVISLISSTWDNDSYSADSEDDQSISDYDDEVLFLVTQMVNTVERLNKL